MEPGETLWSIAAASNLTTNALAAANGLSPDANVVLGSTIQIPSESEAAAALAAQGTTATAPAAGTAAPEPMGGYTVQPGETLSGIAEQWYGDPDRYRRIFQANRHLLEDPDVIVPGQLLRIPQ